MKNDERIINLIIDKVNKDYKDDVALLVQYGIKRQNENELLGASVYFIPKNEKAKSLSTQFIVDGVSYDLFPMSWERLIANAAMDAPQGYLLLDTKVLYYVSEDVLDRFNELKESLKIVLGGSYDKMLINKAYEYLNDCYVHLFNMNENACNIASVRLEAGKMLSKIASAVGFANSEYYKNGHGTVLKDSRKLSNLPKDYAKLMDNIIFCDNSSEIYEKSNELIVNTRAFLLSQKKLNAHKENFETIFTGYYEELKKSINKCDLAVKNKDYYVLYELLAFFEEEISQFFGAVAEGIWYDDRNTLDEYNYFEKYFGTEFLQLIADKEDDKILLALKKFEDDFVSIIKDDGIPILSFDNADGFAEYFIKK